MTTSLTLLTRGALAAVLCVAVFAPLTAAAQTLGDVARREEERRKQPTSGRVYTNDNLEAVEPPATPPAAAAPAAEAPPAEATPKPSPGFVLEEDATGHTNMKTAPAESRRSEQYWRKVLTDVRAKIAALNANIESQQDRLDQIQDDSPSASREREVISGTIERLRKDLALQNGALTRWLALARASKTPEDWLK